MKKNERMFSNLRHDFPASIVVFFVALPLCLGIALASGAPLFAGVIAGIIGGIVVGSISNSSLGVSGPAAGLTVIVLASIETLGSFEIFLVAVVLAGIMQIILGFIKAGIISYYFPSSVIKGMLSAIGIIIILKQIPHAVGYDADYEGDMAFVQADGENTFSELLHMLDSITPGAIIVSLAALIIMLLWDRYIVKLHSFFKLVQGALVAVTFGIVYHYVTSSFFPALALNPKQLVSVPVSDNFIGFFNQFTFPDFNNIFNNDVWIVAVTIAVVASLETLLSVEAADRLDPYKRITNTNRELVAQGTGNMLSGLIGGLPVTQVIVRTSANVHSGGRTKMSTILHGFLLLICVVTIPVVLNMIPLAVLASVLFIVGYKLAKPEVFRQMFRLGWSQFVPFMVTILGVVFTDLLKGIALGMVTAVFIILRNSTKNSHFLHREHTNGQKKIKMTLAEEVIFLNKGAIIDELNKVPEGTHLTIDMTKSVSVDYDVKEVIENFKKLAESRNIEVNVVTSSTGNGAEAAKRSNAELEKEFVN